MATQLTSTGITFSDTTILTSKFGIIPQNSVTFFYQASAPTRWTKSTAHNDKALRVVSETGGGSGGTSPFTSIFPTSLKSVSVANIPVSGTVGNTTLGTTQIASHGHVSGGGIGFSENDAIYEPIYEYQIVGVDSYDNYIYEYVEVGQQFVGWAGGDVQRNPGWTRTGPYGAAYNGGGEAHSHPWSGTASFSQNIDLRVQYIDVLACTFNG